MKLREKVESYSHIRANHVVARPNSISYTRTKDDYPSDARLRNKLNREEKRLIGLSLRTLLAERVRTNRDPFDTSIVIGGWNIGLMQTSYALCMAANIRVELDSSLDTNVRSQVTNSAVFHDNQKNLKGHIKKFREFVDTLPNMTRYAPGDRPQETLQPTPA